MNLLQPLRHPAFSGLWTSYTLSTGATTILPTVLTLTILDWNRGIGDLGVVLSARTMGFLAGALIGGQIADRYRRDGAVIFACLLRALAVLAIAWIFDRNLTAFSVCLFLTGGGEGTFRSAYQSAIADVVGKDMLQQANALTTLSARIVQTAGPLLAVALYGLWGGTSALSLAAALWLLAGATVFCLRRRFPEHRPDAAGSEKRPGLWASYVDGLKEARRHRWFIAGLWALLVWLGIGNAIQQLLLPVVSREVFGGDGVIGVALGCYACGALAGGLLLGSVSIPKTGLIGFIGLALYGLVPLALYSESLALILIAYALAGVGIELFNIPWFTAIQREVPREMLGRVSAIDFLISYGAAPLALAVMPAAIETLGRPTALVAAGLIVIAAPVVCLGMPGVAAMGERRGGSS